MASQGIQPIPINERRYSWPYRPVPSNNASVHNRSHFYSSAHPRLLLRRLSHVVINTHTSLLQPHFMINIAQAMLTAAITISRWVKTWIIIMCKYLWHHICINYAYVSERADLEGSSAIDGVLANRLKNVHYLKYKIRLDYDLYGNIVRMPWSYICAFIALIYLAVSIIFTFAYIITDFIDQQRYHTCWHWLVYSLSVTTCLGSDTLDSNSTHLFLVLLANLQAFISQLLLASVTGIVFARFSRRRRQIYFSDKLIINQVDGVPYLQGRFTPIRPRFGIFNSFIQLHIAKPYHTKEGEHGVSIKPVPLICDALPVIAMMFKFSHRLDESSEVRKALLESNTNFTIFVTVTGAEACTLNPVYDHKRYGRADIVKNVRFIDMVENVYSEGNKKDVYLHFDRLNKVMTCNASEPEDQIFYAE